MKKMMFNCTIMLICTMFTIFLGCFKLLKCYDVATYSNPIDCLFYLSLAGIAAGFILCLDELSSKNKTTK